MLSYLCFILLCFTSYIILVVAYKIILFEKDIKISELDFGYQIFQQILKVNLKLVLNIKKLNI